MHAPSIGRWQVDGGGPISEPVAPGHDYAAYSPDGHWILVFGWIGDGLHGGVWDDAADRVAVELPADTWDATWLDDDRLAIVTTDGRASVLDVPDGARHDIPVRAEPGWLTSAPVPGARVAFGYEDGHVEVLGFDDGSSVRIQTESPWGDQPTPIGQIVASPDGSRIYVVNFGVYAFDAATGRALAGWDDTGISSMAMSADGTIAISRVGGTITLHDADDLSLLGTLP